MSDPSDGDVWEKRSRPHTLPELVRDWGGVAAIVVVALAVLVWGWGWGWDGLVGKHSRARTAHPAPAPSQNSQLHNDPMPHAY